MPKKQNKVDAAINAMDTCEKAIRRLTKYCGQVDQYVVEAFMNQDDARGKELIIKKLRVENLIRSIERLKSNASLAANSAVALAGLKQLPAAIKACEGLMNDRPNFDKLAGSIEGLFGDIDAAEKAIDDLNEKLNPTQGKRRSSSLDDDQEMEDRQAAQEAIYNSDRFKAEYEAAIAKVKAKIAPEAITSPSAAVADPVKGTTGPIDFSGIIEEENKKK